VKRIYDKLNDEEGQATCHEQSVEGRLQLLRVMMEITKYAVFKKTVLYRSD
jgi:hypothetical protein